MALHPLPGASLLLDAPPPTLRSRCRPLPSLAVRARGLEGRRCTLPSLARQAVLLLLQPKALRACSGSLGAPGRGVCHRSVHKPTSHDRGRPVCGVCYTSWVREPKSARIGTHPGRRNLSPVIPLSPCNPAVGVGPPQVTLPPAATAAFCLWLSLLWFLRWPPGGSRDLR